VKGEIPQVEDSTAGSGSINDLIYFEQRRLINCTCFSFQKTPFYITLDADVLCTKDGLLEDDLLEHGKGTYAPEE